jgi:hypothetical protein
VKIDDFACRKPSRPGVGYTASVMSKTVAEASTELDALRERLGTATERLSWLRSYL